MSFWNGQSGGVTAAPPAAAKENTARQFPAVGEGAVTVMTTAGRSVTEVSELDDLLHGRLQIGTVGILIVGLVVFYLWTRNVQGGG